MPVTAQVGGVPGYHHQVAGSDGDLLVAPRTEVRLAGFVGLNYPDLVGVGFVGHRASILRRPPIRRRDTRMASVHILPCPPELG